MAGETQITTHELWVDGRKMEPTVIKLDPTTLRISWTLPSPIQAYDGAVVLLSEEKFSSLNFPVDGTRYTASTNWTAPADTIDHAKVVAAFYGFFGDSTTQTFVDVSNIDPNKVYYASIHAASNVLQYYTIGTQSYPLESSRFEKAAETYAGSIPISSVVPENPTNGQVYFDPTINRVFVWNDDAQAWLLSSQETVPVGERPEVVPLQAVFNFTENALKIFYNGAWVTGTSTNERVKLGPTWVPLGTASTGAQLPASPAAGDIAYISTAPLACCGTNVMGSSEVYVYTVGQWFRLTSDLVQFDTTGFGGWENIVLGIATGMNGDLPPPIIGNFFYDKSARDLLIWTGEEWTKADVAQEGTPITDKIGVGNDGSYDERLRLIKILKGQMGWPQICVELSEEQFNIAIDNALDEFRRRADNAYKHRYVLFTLKSGQDFYYLNDPRNDTDKIVNVMKIHRINLLGATALSSQSIWTQAFFQQFFYGSMVDVLSIHLVHQLSETFEKIFAGNMTFTWDEASRQLQLLRRAKCDDERVVMEVVMERTEQELLLDRWAKQWLQGWAHAELKEMLGMIRSKYGTLPGPTGGLTLNGDLLISEARADFEELLRQMTDYEVGNGGVDFQNCAFFIG